MTALVTGGTGFLGRSVVAGLLADGWRVRCLVRVGSSVRPVRDRRRAGGRVAGCTHIFHLAAEMRGATAVLFLTNVVGSRNLLDAAVQAGVERFVLVSSLAVYDSGRLRRGDCLDETCPIEPQPHLRDAYTYSKVVQEQVAWEAHRVRGLPLAVIRPGVIYGPGRDCLSGRVGLVVGKYVLAMGGRQTMPYTHVANCARAVVLAGTAPNAVGRAVNVIDDETPTGRGLLKAYRRAVGGVRSVTVPGALVPVLSGLYEWYNRRSRGQLPAVLTRYRSRAMWTPLRYSNAEAKAVLGWRPEKTVADGLHETFDWLNRQKKVATTATG